MKRLTYSNSMQKRRHRHKLILPLLCILLLVTGCGNLYTGDESLYDPNHQEMCIRDSGMGVYETDSFELETLQDSHILLIEVPM